MRILIDQNEHQLLYKIFRYVMPKDLARLRLACQTFYFLINNDDFWQEMIDFYNQVIHKIILSCESKSVDEQQHILLHYFINQGLYTLKIDYQFVPNSQLMNLYLQALHTIRTFTDDDLIIKAVNASSTNLNHTLQCTLCPLNPQKFWQSKPFQCQAGAGGDDVSSNSDYIIYTTSKKTLHIFSKVQITFFRQIEHWDQPVYTSKYVKFHFGYGPNKFHSQTPKFLVTQQYDGVQVFDLLPFIGWGRYLKIQLFGKSTRIKGVEAPYFVSVQNVRVFGMEIKGFQQSKSLMKQYLIHHCQSIVPSSSIVTPQLQDSQVLSFVSQLKSMESLDDHYIQQRIRPLLDQNVFAHKVFIDQCVIKMPSLLELAIQAQIAIRGVLTFPVLDLLIKILLVKKNKDTRFIYFVSFMNKHATFANRESLKFLIDKNIDQLELKISINLLMRIDFVDQALQLAIQRYPKTICFQELLNLYRIGSGKVPINMKRVFDKLQQKFDISQIRSYTEKRNWIIKHVGNHQEIWQFIHGLELWLNGDKSAATSSIAAAGSSGALGMTQVVAQHQSMSSMQQMMTSKDFPDLANQKEFQIFKK